MTLVFTLTSLEVAPRIGFAVAAGLTLLAGLVSTLRAPVAVALDGRDPSSAAPSAGSS